MMASQRSLPAALADVGHRFFKAKLNRVIFAVIKLEADIAKQLEQARYRYRPDNRFVVIQPWWMP